MCSFTFLVGAFHVSVDHYIVILLVLFLSAVTFYDGMVTSLSCVTFTFSRIEKPEAPEDKKEE